MSIAIPTHAAFDSVAPFYDAQPNPMLELEERYLTGLLPGVRGLAVLDVGCGTGRWLRNLADLGARTLTGVDPSECMLAMAREKLGSRARLFHSTAESLPLLDASADVILLSFVMSYCEDLDAVLHEVARVARPDATIFVSDVHPGTEAAFGWKRTFASQAGTVAMATARHQRETLESAFRRAGFEVAARVELPFDDADWDRITNAGKAPAMQDARQAPAIYIAQFVSPRPESRQSIAIENGRVAIAASAATRTSLTFAGGKLTGIGVAAGRVRPTIDVGGCLVLPGLINAHDHLEFGLYPKLGNGPYENSVQWARDIHSRERDLIEIQERVPKDVRLYFGGLRNLLSGVTTVCQHNPYAPAFRNPDFPVRVIENIDWAHSLAFDRQGVLSGSEGGRAFVIHAAEGTDTTASGEIAELDAMGVIGERTVLVHALGCSEQDIDLINRRGASVVVCASSNAFLYGATLSPESIRQLKKVALGTDSPMTSGGSMLDEIRIAQTCFESSPPALYRMCTDESARVLQLGSGEGRIGIGGPADLLVVRDQGGSPADALCGLSFEQIELVVIGGSVRLASDSGLQRLPADTREHLRPLLVDGREVWVHAPLAWMFEQAHAVLGEELSIGGKRVDYVG